MLKEKLQAILSLIDGEVDSIEIQDENTVEIDGAEYKVLTGEEADEEFRSYQESLWDDMGIQSFSKWAQDYILENLVEEDWFNDAMEESYQFYADDIENESASNDEYNNRLEEEMAEADVETKEDFIKHLCNGWSNGIEWYKDNFGLENMAQVVRENNLVDFDAVVDWVKETDGRGCISGYDGEENEINGYYIYRTN